MIGFFKKLFGLPQRRIIGSGRTDAGRVRSHNEDNFRIMSDRQVFVVADGMGGHNAGEVASEAAIETLDKYCSKQAIRKIKGNSEEIRHFFIRGFNHTNDVIMRMAQEDESRSGMGCTMVSCMVDGDLLHACHVGDARCYVAESDGLEQLTNDHSATAAYDEEVRSGNHTNMKRPPRQVITRAIGFPFQEDPEYHCREIRPGNRVLLCSDGLWSMVDDGQIYEILISSRSAEDASATLVDKANEAGGRDNITAVVIFC